jgi:hypothetical protein
MTQFGKVLELLAERDATDITVFGRWVLTVWLQAGGVGCMAARGGLCGPGI